MSLSKLNCFKRIFYSGVNFHRVCSRFYSDSVEGSEECGKTNASSGGHEGGKKGLVLGVYEEKGKFILTKAAEEIDQKSEGKLCRYLNELSGELRLGKAFAVTDLVPEYSVVALSSFGPKDAGYNELEELDEDRENVRWGVGAGVRVLTERGCSAVAVDCGDAPEPAAEAAHLAAWRFQEFKSTQQPKVALSQYGVEDSECWVTGSVLGEAQNWARYLSDMPANKMTPVDLAQAALDVLCPLGVRVAVRDGEWAAAARLRAFLAVARGACAQPALVQCEYRAADTQPVLMVAKGVTFDSGGLCLKPAPLMEENRGSMAGAAVTLATLQALATLKVPINVCAVLPLCENMISGQCMKVGDVVTALNGVSILIEDTDMEGRLMMADALVYGQSVYKPSLVIDVATLTRGVAQGLGGGPFGSFASGRAGWAALRRAGAASGDRPCRLPLWDYYSSLITDDPSVDLRNKGSETATPCIGAAFLRKFVCGEWLHLDITGVGKLAGAAPPYLAPRRMSGRPARTLAYFLRDAARARAHPPLPQER